MSKAAVGSDADAGGADTQAVDNAAFGRILAEQYPAWGNRDYENMTAVAYDEPVVDDDGPCDKYLDSFEDTAMRINNARIGYHTFSANSNSVANTMLVRAGLGRGSLRRGAIAGNVVLLP